MGATVVWYFLQFVIGGLTAGSTYALVGLGFVLIYQATRSLNFAQGDTLMLGAIMALVMHLDNQWGYWPTLLGVALFGCVVGAVLHWVAYQPLSQSPAFSVILATVAFGQILRGLVRVLRGNELRSFPPMVDGKPIIIGELILTPASLAVAGLCLVAMGAFALLLRFTRMGKAMRAVAQNKSAASLMGVNVRSVTTMVWALGTAFASVAGMLIAPLITITPDMGAIAMKGFVGAILGGFTSITGAVVGGFLLGVIDNLVAGYISTSMRDVGTFLVMLVVLWYKPQGLLAGAAERRV